MACEVRVTTSNNDWWQVDKNSYITAQMSNISFPAGAVIDSVKIHVEHYEENGFGSNNLEWKVGTGWPSGATTWGTLANPPVHTGEGNEATDIWDVTAFVDTTQKLNDLELHYWNQGNNKKTNVDRIHVVVDWHE